MSASVHTLPIWKKDSTAAEWLEELAGLARENPERWSSVIVCFEENNAEDLSIKTRWHSRGYLSNTAILGALECLKLELFEYMKGRRT